jgi:uncharacterized protein (TIGR03067 family)
MMRADLDANLTAQIRSAFEALQGHWSLEEWHIAGEVMPVAPDDQYVEFTGGRCILVNIMEKPGPVIAELILDAQNPGHVLDFVVDPDDQPQRRLCLYELTGDTLRLSIGFPNSPRPESLDSQRGARHHSYQFKRAPAASRSQPPPSPD